MFWKPDSCCRKALKKELLHYDLPISYLIQRHFIHLHSWLAFECHVHAHGAYKIISCYVRFIGIAAVHLLNHRLPLRCFGADAFNSFHILPERVGWLNALRTLVIQIREDLVKTPLLSQIIETVSDFTGGHCFHVELLAGRLLLPQ